MPNGSFENYSVCPTNYSQQNATSWEDFGSSDYFNTCNNSINGIMGVPLNDLGYQIPFEGNSYAGVISADGPGSGWEFLQVRLIQPLDSGKKYCVRFYINLSDSSSWAADSLGALLSDTNLNLATPFPIVPQVLNPNYITDKDNWVLVKGELIANGKEELLTIGNFGHNINSGGDLYVGGGCTFNPVSNPDCLFCYYYIDSVSVTLCPEPVPPPPPAPPFSIPTLLSNSDLFYIQGLDGHVSLTLYDARGRLVYENAQYINDLSLYPFAEGIYFYRIVLQDGRMERGKLVIGRK